MVLADTDDDYVEPADPCTLCKGEGAIGTGLSESFVDASDAMECPRCGGSGEDLNP